MIQMSDTLMIMTQNTKIKDNMKQMITKLLLLSAMALVSMGAVKAQGDCSITLPYSMNFDSLTATGGTSFVPCWTRVNAATSGNATYPNIYDYGTYAATGHVYGNVLSFTGNSASSTGTMRAATPLIPAPLNSLDLSFAVFKNTLKLYAATDATDLSTYHLIGSYAPGYTWITYEVRTDTISGLPSAQGYLVFTADFGTGYGHDNPYLDELVISALNSCERPSSVTVEEVSPTSVSLSWPAVSGVTSYLVRYNTTDDITTASEETVTGTTVEIEDLLPNTEYHVWVQSLCSETSESDPRTTVVTTEMSCYPLVNLHQASAGFDAVSYAWEFDPRGNAPTSVLTVLRDLDDPTSVVEMESTGETSHIVSDLIPTHSYEVDFYTLCDGDTATMVTLPVTFKVCGESQLAALAGNYDMHPVPAGYNYGYAQMMYPADVFLDMDTIRGIALHRASLNQSSAAPITRTLSIWMHCTSDTSHNSAVSVTGMTQVANDVTYNFPVQEWDTIYFTTPFVYTEGENVILTIDDNTGTHVSTGAAQWLWHEQSWKTHYKNNDDSNPNPAAITGVTNTQRCPDMHFVGSCNTDLSCTAPVVAVGMVDSASATINWVGSATVYTLEYRTSGATTWTVASSEANAPYTLENLLPATHYEVRVGVLCDGASNLRYSDVVTFTTGCALMDLPFHFTQTDMCAAADNGFTPCWSRSQYFYKGRLTNSHRGYVRNVDLNEWFMLPAINGDLSNARLRTWAASSTDAQVKVGIASLSNASDVVWVDTIFITASQPDFSHDEYVSYLDNYTGTGNRVVVSPIVTNLYHYVYFFDFHVELIEDCRPVENIVLDSSSATTLSISWTPRGGTTQWAVEANGQRTVVSGQPHCTLTGLSAYTNYEVSVRSLCGEDSSALTSEHFRTACSGEQCTFTLAAHASGGEGWKGAHLHIIAAGEMIEDFTMLQGSNRSISLTVCENMPLVFKWYSGNEDSECSFDLIKASGDTVYSLLEGLGYGDTLFVTNNMCAAAPVPTCTDRYESLVVSACDEYLWHGLTLTASGTYRDTVSRVVEGRCDSIYTLTLTIHESYSTDLDSTAEGSFTWHDSVYTASGTYTWADTTRYGCDSVETLHLTILHPGTTCEDLYSTVEEDACDSYQWHGLTLTVSGTYRDTVFGAVEGGCDSIYTLTLTINESYSRTIDTTAEGSFTWHGTTYTESGTYSWEGTTVAGCDSVETLHLTVTPAHSGINDADGIMMALYPNPTSGLVKVVAEGIEKVEVYDATGRLVMTVCDSDVVDLSHMSTGVYTLRVTLPEGMAMRKVLKR